LLLIFKITNLPTYSITNFFPVSVVDFAFALAFAFAFDLAKY